MPGFVRLLIFVGLLITVAATARLGLVVAATPSDLWLDAQPRLVDLSAPADRSAEAAAQVAARFVNDPALIRGELQDCRAPELGVVPDAAERAERNRRCMAVVDAALAAAPTSGEVWLFKADRLLRTAELDPAIEALRKSYVTTPHEGWIASGRVVLGLQLYPLLPAELRTAVGDDLRLVIRYPEFTEPLLVAYTSNAALRQAAMPALQELPADLFEAFISRARDRS